MNLWRHFENELFSIGMACKNKSVNTLFSLSVIIYFNLRIIAKLKKPSPIFTLTFNSISFYSRWSCGIVLVTMLTGELPWEQAIPELSVSYRNWASGKSMVDQNPWAKIDNTALCKFIVFLQQTLNIYYSF